MTEFENTRSKRSPASSDGGLHASPTVGTTQSRSESSGLRLSVTTWRGETGAPRHALTVPPKSSIRISLCSGNRSLNIAQRLPRARPLSEVGEYGSAMASLTDRTDGEV